MHAAGRVGRRRRTRRWPVVGLGVLVGLVIAAMLAIHFSFPTPAFPDPRGSFQVGTRGFRLEDPNRAEAFVAGSGGNRQLVMQVWYPARPTPDATPVRYQDGRAVTDQWATMMHLPPWTLSRVREAPTHSYRDAPAADGRFPVLLYLSGLGGGRNASLSWIEDLVAHGYVVAGLDQPGASAATRLQNDRVVPMLDRTRFQGLMPLALAKTPGRIPQLNGVPLPGGAVPYLAKDVSFAIDELGRLAEGDSVFGGHLDMDRVGVFGISLGGFVGPEAARSDPRIKAVLVADAGQTAAVAAHGLSQPVLVMGRDADAMREERRRAGGWPEEEIRGTVAEERALFERSSGGAWFLTMNAMHHVNWTDAPLFSPWVRWSGLGGDLEPATGYAAVNAWTRAFFDHTLKDQVSELLDGAPSAWPDFTLRSRKPDADPAPGPR